MEFDKLIKYKHFTYFSRAINFIAFIVPLLSINDIPCYISPIMGMMYCFSN